MNELRKASRKEINTLLTHIDSVKANIDYLESKIKKFFDETELQGARDSLAKEKSRLLEIRKNLPLGHRYDGEYYLKNPPPEYGFRKEEGPLFMREDLVSWIRLKKEDMSTSYYLRAVFSEPKDDAYLMRDQGKPIYEHQENLAKPDLLSL